MRNDSVIIEIRRPYGYRFSALKGNPIVGELWLVHYSADEGLRDGEVHICDTLEPPYRSKYSYIREGVYRMSVTYSPKFHRKLPLLHDVPGRSGIRIHAGNTASDTHGCILVGKKSPCGLSASFDHLCDVMANIRDQHISIVSVVETSPFYHFVK